MKLSSTSTRKTLWTLLLLGLALVWILPFFWMVSTSFKHEGDVFSYPIEWIPSNWDFANYVEVFFGSHPFPLYYFNSIVVSASVVVGTLLVNSLAGYSFARIKFKGRDAIFLLYLASIMIPMQVTLIPRYILLYWFGMINTRFALVLPPIFNAIIVFLLRQFYLQIPFDLSESARIDGASEFQTWARVIMPLTKPAMMTAMILAFTWSWKDYLNPIVFLHSKHLFTITIGLNAFIDEYGQQYGNIMAASVASMVPMLLIFLFGQRYFIEGIARTGIKG